MEDRELYEHINDILVEHGIQAGADMVSKAFYASGIWYWSGVSSTPSFPPRLECHREWLSRLTSGKADEVRLYMTRATSLAYRYLRKKCRIR